MNTSPFPDDTDYGDDIYPISLLGENHILIEETEPPRPLPGDEAGPFISNTSDSNQKITPQQPQSTGLPAPRNGDARND